MSIWRKYAHIFFTLVVGIGLSFVAFVVAVDWTKRNVQTKFNRISQLQALQIEDSLTDNMDFVRTVAALHHVTEEIKFNAFSTFVKHFLPDHPGLDGVIWAPRVQNDKRQEHEVGATHHQTYKIIERDADGKIVAAQARDEYFPVYYAEYAEPYVSEAYPIGMDLSSRPRFRQRMEKARDMGELVMKKGGAELVIEGGLPKYLVIYPVYTTKAKALDSIEQRREDLLGYVIGVEDMGDALEYSLDDTAIKGIDVRLFDLSDGIIPELVHVHKSKLRVDYSGHEAVTPNEGLKFEKHFSAAGREWLIVTTPAPGYFSSDDSWIAWVVLGVGFFGTIVFSAYLLGLAKQADKTENLVVQRTAELSLKKRELEAYSDALAHSNDELQQFAYVASHDLQEPLRMVSSFTQLLKQRYGEQLDENANEYIDFAIDGVERMRALINDLLTYSRVDTTGRELKSTDMVEVMGWALSNLRATINEAQADISYDELPRVRGDKSQLQRLMQNLISNAVKYRSETRKPTVKIGAVRDGHEWLFSVTDNGVGIDSKYYERIFEIFQRLHAHDLYPGSGMGLAICKKIVKRHGGRIWLTQGPGGVGTTVNFTLPAVEAEPEAKEIDIVEEQTEV